MEKEKIILTTSRDFSAVINSIFEFVKQEYRRFGKTIVWYAGIPILITSIVSAFNAQNEISQVLEAMIQNGAYIEQSGSNLLLSILIAVMKIAVYILISGLTGAYLLLYSQKEDFSSQAVWEKTSPLLGKLFGIYLTTLALTIVIGLLGFLALFGIGTLTAQSSMAIPFLFIGVILLLIIPLFYTIVPFSLSFIALMDRNNGLIDALKYAFQVVYKKWWLSFSVIAVMAVIVIILSTLFTLPIIVTGAINSYLAMSAETIQSSRSIALLITAIISDMGQFIIFPLVTISCGIQYLNLREQKENRTLQEEIEQINHPLNNE